MSSQEALRLAEERNLDLVKISPNAVPPVCKLMDYGKYRFEQTKRLYIVAPLALAWGEDGAPFLLSCS